jgi:prepilin-type N-terminal cleavage/methylation domain-containing protein
MSRPRFAQAKSFEYPACTAGQQRSASGFTLIELLVVIAIIALLVSILLPSMQAARMQARMVIAHSDLRQINLALEMYQDAEEGHLPPVRAHCELGSEYGLPSELGSEKYLPANTDGEKTLMELTDPFTRLPYRFRTAGPLIMNGQLLENERQWAKLWVPDDYPVNLSYTPEKRGRYIRDPDESPIRYTLWTVGPKPDAQKLSRDSGKAPVLEDLWMMDSRDVGIITHIMNKRGNDLYSP